MLTEVLKAAAMAGQVGSLIAKLPLDAVKQVADAALDVAENYIGETRTEVDDAVLLPAIGGVRKVLNIPDNDLAQAPGQLAVCE